MPTKYKSKKKTVRKKRAYKARPRNRIILSGFPQSKLVKLRYVDTSVTLNAGIGLTDSYVYRANSVYDPDYSGVGHQPMGYDQWAALYNRYTVLGAKITITPNVPSTTNVNSSIYGITLSGDISPLGNYTSIDNILESKLTSVSKICGSYVGAQSMKQLSLSRYFSAKKFFGVADVKDGAALSAEVTASPSKDAYFGVWTASIDGNDPGSLSFRVIIDYIVAFREPKNLDGS